MCGGLPPNESTPTMGWKHVTAGGKEACHGDYGAPLICDIDGKATLVGVHSIGDLTECGLDGRPAIHTEVQQVKHWMDYTMKEHGPPSKCFDIIVDMNIDDALGDEIEIYHTKCNGEKCNEESKVEKVFRPALKSQQSRNPRPVCVVETNKGDKFTFKLKEGGKDNVSQCHF